jgi:hypothetical protein
MGVNANLLFAWMPSSFFLDFIDLTPQRGLPQRTLKSCRVDLQWTFWAFISATGSSQAHLIY